MARVRDPQFVGCGQKPGTEIWRLKNFKVEKVKKEEHGIFFNGDSYIVLSTFGKAGHFSHNVHFWLGEETTPDEAGTAAIKTVELDDFLGGGPVQYREVQNHESPVFLSYFKNGIKYMKGGYESGFGRGGSVQVRTRLFHCKGKRNVRIREVNLSKESLNKGDVFILDKGSQIYVWMPPQAGRTEKIKGVDAARNIRDIERGGRANIEICDADWDKNEDFWKTLGGFGPVKSADEGGVDDDFMKKEKDIIALYRVSDQTGHMKVDNVQTGTLNPSMLDSNDAFILDAVSGGIFVWIGKGCTMNERKKAMIWAADYLQQKKRPPWIQVVRVLEEAEPSIFTQWFSGPTTVKTKAPPVSPTSKSTAKQDTSFKVSFMPHLFQCSDSSGKITIEEIANFAQEDLNEDDVMILDGGSEIFVWNGSGSTSQEKKMGLATAEKYLSVDSMARPKGAKVVVIDQGREPPEFTKHFLNWNPAFKGHQSVESALAKLTGVRL